jgi:transposase
MRIAPSIDLSVRQREILERLIRSPTVEQRLVQRALFVLAAATQGGLSRDLAEDLGMSVNMVGRWRRRWAAAQGRLMAAEQGPRPDLSHRITETLVDAPRSGFPGIFTPEQILEIIAIACEQPEEEADRPVTHWTPREVADEAMKRKIVSCISTRTVGRFLKSNGHEAPSGPILDHPGAGGSTTVS